MSVAAPMSGASPLSNILKRAESLGYNVQPSPPAERSVISKIAELNEFRKAATEASVQLLNCEKLASGANQDSLKSIEHMNQELSFMLNHVQKIISQKETISAYLQQPFVGDHIVVEVDYQSDVQKLFKTMSETLNSMPRFVEALEWACRLRLDDDQLEKKLSALSSLLARCQRFHDALNDLRAAMQFLAASNGDQQI